MQVNNHEHPLRSKLCITHILLIKRKDQDPRGASILNLRPELLLRMDKSTDVAATVSWCVVYLWGRPAAPALGWQWRGRTRRSVCGVSSADVCRSSDSNPAETRVTQSSFLLQSWFPEAGIISPPHLRHIPRGFPLAHAESSTGPFTSDHNSASVDCFDR